MWTMLGLAIGAVVDFLMGARPRPMKLRFPMKFILAPGVDPQTISGAVGLMMEHPDWTRSDFERLLWVRGLTIDSADVVRKALLDSEKGDAGPSSN